jgi:hypothetical protein
MAVALPTLAPVSPGRPSPFATAIEAPPAPEPESQFYVLAAGGVWGPVTSSELAAIAETTYALTGSEVVVTPA